MSLPPMHHQETDIHPVIMTPSIEPTQWLQRHPPYQKGGALVEYPPGGHGPDWAPTGPRLMMSSKQPPPLYMKPLASLVTSCLGLVR